MRKFLFLFLILFCSCKETKNEKIAHQLNKWLDKEIYFPQNIEFTSLGGKSRNLLQEQWDYAIVSYVDSIGCISCKLQLDIWKKLIEKKDEVFEKKVSVLLFLHPLSRKELLDLLKKYKFDYPVCIDENDSFNKLNHFPSDMMFQTFLLDKNDKVVAIGNPVHNPKIKELYLNIIQGKKDVESEKTLRTEITIKEPIISLGHFNWKEEKKTAFKIENTGKYPLIINDVTTSCGCTSVDYSKEPVRPGDSISLQVTYKADHPEHFDKTITVYCNANPSLVHLKIMGDAE